MKLRKRAIGDLYLAASVIFIFLSFFYFGFKGNGWAFLIIGLAIALFGIKTKEVMKKREEQELKKSKIKKPKKKR